METGPPIRKRKALIGLTLVVGLIVFGERWVNKQVTDAMLARLPDHPAAHYPDFSAAQADFGPELACLQEIIPQGSKNFSISVRSKLKMTNGSFDFPAAELATLKQRAHQITGAIVVENRDNSVTIGFSAHGKDLWLTVWPSPDDPTHLRGDWTLTSER